MYGWQITHGKILEMEGRLVAKGKGGGEGCVGVFVHMCVSKKAAGGYLCLDCGGGFMNLYRQ